MATLFSRLSASSPFNGKQAKIWLLYPLVAFALALLLYGLLPGIGVHLPIPAADKIILLGAIAIAGLLYLLMLELLLKRPWWIIYYILLGWRVLEYWNSIPITLQIPLPSLPIRISTFFIIGLPCILIALFQFKKLWHELPYFKWLLSFLTISILYFFFYNAHFVDPNSANLDYIDAGRSFILNTFYWVACIIATYYGVRQHSQPLKLFNTINRMLLIYSIVEGVCVIVGYPFHLFTMDVDGFVRSMGFSPHPNHLAHDVAIRILYILGLTGFYGHSKNQDRVSPQLIYTSLGIMLFTSLLALSKGSLGISIMLLLVYLIVLAVFFNQRKPLISTSVGLALFAPIFLLSFQAFTGENFAEMVQSRVDNVGSLTFRTDSWNDLMNNIPPSKYPIGMGLSSSNEFMFQRQLNNSLLNKTGGALSLVHNLSVNLFYDMGLIGMTYYLVPLVYVLVILQYLGRHVPTRFRLLGVSGLLVLAYITAASQADEIGFSIIAYTAWVLITLILGLLKREWTHIYAFKNLSPSVE